MNFKSLMVTGSMFLFALQADAQTKMPDRDSLKREDSLRKERAARADVYVSGKNILTHEQTSVDTAITTKKAAVQRKRKGCRKNRR